ncbi:MAG: MFS transporter [Minwuia sp.]|nr:MFS transporter [Minwuia sp.]
MSSAAEPDVPPERVDRSALASLAGTFLTQGAAAFGFIGFSLLAPGLAEETGQDERDFGLAFSFIFLGSALASPLCGTMMQRFGSVGTMLITLAGMACVVMIALFGTWATVMLAAFLYGLFYGPANIIVITRKAPRKHVGLFLAIRQSGVSFAGAGGGFILPAVMLAVGWQVGVWAIAGTLVFAIVITLAAAPVFRVAPERPTMKTELQRTFPRRLAARFVLPPNLRLLGWLSDRTGKPELVLLGIAIAATLSIILAMLITSDTPLWMIYPVALLAGL